MRYFYLLSFFILLACNSTQTGKEPLTRTRSSQDQIISTPKNRIFNQPIVLDSIKNFENIEFTSGVDSYHCELNEGFFGGYYLIDKDVNQQFANLTVLAKVTPHEWFADLNNEQFVSIEIFTKKLVIWESLYNGLKRDKLDEFIGNQFNYQKGQTVYADFGKYEGIFNLQNDSVLSFTIKTKCDSIN